jgi:hypothetical protein
VKLVATVKLLTRMCIHRDSTDPSYVQKKSASTERAEQGARSWKSGIKPRVDPCFVSACSIHGGDLGGLPIEATSRRVRGLCGATGLGNPQVWRTDDRKTCLALSQPRRPSSSRGGHGRHHAALRSAFMQFSQSRTWFHLEHRWTTNSLPKFSLLVDIITFSHHNPAYSGSAVRALSQFSAGVSHAAPHRYESP